MLRGVRELQKLGDELDVDEPAGDIFDVPAVGVALLLRDRGGGTAPRE